MQIFVMGGTGLIGSSVVDRLSERGDRVVLLTRRPAMAQERWGGRCTIIEGDPRCRSQARSTCALRSAHCPSAAPLKGSVA